MTAFPTLSVPAYDWNVPETTFARENYERVRRRTWTAQTEATLRPESSQLVIERHRLAAAARHATDAARSRDVEGVIPLLDSLHNLWSEWMAHGSEGAWQAVLLTPGESKLTPAHPMSVVARETVEFIIDFFNWLSELAARGEVDSTFVNAKIRETVVRAAEQGRLRLS